MLKLSIPFCMVSLLPRQITIRTVSFLSIAKIEIISSNIKIRLLIRRKLALSNNHSTFLGVLFCMLAGATWALAFLIPNMLSNFSSLEITLGRYLMYGLYSLLFFMAFKNVQTTSHYESGQEHCFMLLLEM